MPHPVHIYIFHNYVSYTHTHTHTHTRTHTHLYLYFLIYCFNNSTYLLLLYFSCIAVCCMLGALEKVLLKYIIHSLRVFKLYPVDSSNSCGQISSCNVCRASATADAAKWLGKYCKYGSPSSIDNSHKYWNNIQNILKTKKREKSLKKFGESNTHI